MNAVLKYITASIAASCLGIATPVFATVLTLDESGNYVVSEGVKSDAAKEVLPAESAVVGDSLIETSEEPTPISEPTEEPVELSTTPTSYDVFLIDPARVAAVPAPYRSGDKLAPIELTAMDVPTTSTESDESLDAASESQLASLEPLSLDISALENGPVIAAIEKPLTDKTPTEAALSTGKMPAFEPQIIEGSAGSEIAYSGAYNDLIEAEIAKYTNVDMAFVTSVIEAESNYDITAVSPKGAMGLMQIMPETAKIYKVINPFSPAENIRAGTAELSRLMDVYNNPALALAAYNAGQGAVETYDGVPPYRETQEYIVKVLTKTFEKRERLAKAEIVQETPSEKDKKFEPMQVQTFEWDAQ